MLTAPRRRALATVLCLALGTLVVLGSSTSAGLNAQPTYELKVLELPELEFRLADRTPGPGLQQAATSSGETIWIAHSAIVTHKDVVGARMIEQNGRFNIGLEFTSEAAERVAMATKNHVGKAIAIVLDRQIISAPVLEAPISDSAMISGSFTKQEVQDLLVPFQRLAKKNRSERGFFCNWIGWC